MYLVLPPVFQYRTVYARPPAQCKFELGMSSPYPPYPPPSSSLSTRFPIKNLSPVGVIFFLIIAVGGSRRLLLLLKECMFARRL